MFCDQNSFINSNENVRKEEKQFNRSVDSPILVLKAYLNFNFLLFSIFVVICLVVHIVLR